MLKIILKIVNFDLVEYFNLKEIDKPKDNILKIKLIDINKITNMHCLFNQCNNLISLPDINKWNTNCVNDMGVIFNGCISLEKLSDISKWNTNNVKNMNNIFYNCSSLLKFHFERSGKDINDLQL